MLSDLGCDDVIKENLMFMCLYMCVCIFRVTLALPCSSFSMQAMMMLKHPSVVQLEELQEDQNFVYLVMELCGGGTLLEHLKMKVA